MPEFWVLAWICSWSWLNQCNLKTWQGWSLYLSRRPAAGQETTCWLSKRFKSRAGEITVRFRHPGHHSRWHHHADRHQQQQCSAALLQTRPLGYPEEPLVLLGKQKINLQAHLQGSGLTYLPLPLEGRRVQAATAHPRRKNLSSFPHACPSTALEDALSVQPPGEHTLLPWHYQGTPDKPSCTWRKSTKVPSLQLLGLDRTKLIISSSIPWSSQPAWTTERKRHSCLGACNFFWLFFPENPQIEYPCSYRAEYG